MTGTVFHKGILVVAIAAVPVALMTACPEAQSKFVGTATCRTMVDLSSTSPAAGVLTLTGQFYANESVLLQTVQNGQRVTVATGTPSTDRPSLTFTNMPSGDRYYDLVISCAAGQDDRGNRSFSVK